MNRFLIFFFFKFLTFLGIVGCSDSFTANFVKDVANEYKPSVGKLRGWLKNEFENKIIFSGYLKGKTWQNMVPTEAMNKIFKMNKLGNPNYTLVAYTKSDNGVQLSFEADVNLAVALEKLGNNLKAGLSKFKLQRK